MQQGISKNLLRPRHWPLGIALVVLLGACLVPPTRSPARGACLSNCQRNKDACVLHAQTSEELQRCDYEATDCLHSCPP